jgi:hypothetical protein
VVQFHENHCSLFEISFFSDKSLLYVNGKVHFRLARELTLFATQIFTYDIFLYMIYVDAAREVRLSAREV